ncbi:MAG: 23S rRNA (guanosine(2251)-2'-O)-methyltransferase RlmB [Rhodospirillales bacterium]
MVLIIMAKRKHPPHPSNNRMSRAGRKPRRRRSHGWFSGAQAGPGDGSAQAADGHRGKPFSRADGAFWIYGVHAVEAALTNPRRACHRLLVANGAGGDVVADIARARAAVPGRPLPESVDRGEIERLLTPGAVHQGVALLAKPLPPSSLEDVLRNTAADDAIVVLDQATDPRNVGAVLRSAAAFGAIAVVTQDRNAPPLTGALVKAASGAVETVPLLRVVNLARALWALKDAGFWCAGLDPTAERTLAEASLEGRVALVLGAEGGGMRRLTRDTCDELLRVPIMPGADSLNLSNAAAIALYELKRRQR